MIPNRAGQVTLDDYGWGPDGPRRGWYDGQDLYKAPRGFRGDLKPVDIPLGDDVEPPVLILYSIGTTGYAVGPDFHIIDTLGLADPWTARFAIPAERPRARLPGHEKWVPAAWLAARLTPKDASVRASAMEFLRGEQLIPLVHGEAFQLQVAWARATLECTELIDLHASIEAPMDPTQFLSNIADSFASSQLRIPPEPKNAYRKLCGTGTPPQVREIATR